MIGQNVTKTILKNEQRLSLGKLHFYMIVHFPFSAQGLFFLSGAWMRGSFFSFSSTYSLIAAMLFDNGQRSIDAWYFIFSICFFSASLSMFAIVLASIGRGWRLKLSRKRRKLVQAGRPQMAGRCVRRIFKSANSSLLVLLCNYF